MTEPRESSAAPAAGTASDALADALSTRRRSRLAGLRHRPLGWVGVTILVLAALFCFVGPLVYQTDQTDVQTLNSFLPPGDGYPLGTDSQGFDVLGRIMLGGQASLLIGLITAAIATIIGTVYGAIAGLAGGWVDAVMMRLVDTLMSIPFLFIVLILATRYSSTIWTLSLVLGLFAWLVPARLVRGEVLVLRVRDFVVASRGMGARGPFIIAKHLIPNALGVVAVNITFQVADAIIAVATLGFLGFGLHYPQTDWGGQLSDGVTHVLDGYWWLIYPVGFCLVAVVMALNFVGDALRDAVDVRLRRR